MPDAFTHQGEPLGAWERVKYSRGRSRPEHLEGLWGGGGKDHEAKVTSLSRGMPPGNKFEFWVSEIAVPGEIPTYMTH